MHTFAIAATSLTSSTSLIGSPKQNWLQALGELFREATQDERQERLIQTSNTLKNEGFKPFWELTYPIRKGLWKMIFPFPRWQYVSSLEGRTPTSLEMLEGLRKFGNFEMYPNSTSCVACHRTKSSADRFFCPKLRWCQALCCGRPGVWHST